MDIIGHRKERELLSRIAARGVLQHGFLFFGPSHIGKSLLAKEFAQALLGIGEAEGARLHPDLLILTDGEERADAVSLDLSVDSVREAKEFLSRSPTLGKYRIAIVLGAERLNDASQNALLKILEEPNSSSILLLVSDRFGAILPTILSRVVQIPFRLVPEKELKEGVAKLFPPNEISRLEPFFFLLGRPGMVVTALREGEKFSEKREILRRLFRVSTLSYVERAKLSEALSNDMDRARELLEWWLSGLRASALREIDSRRQAKFFEIIERIDCDIRKIGSIPVNAKLFFDRIVFSL